MSGHPLPGSAVERLRAHDVPEDELRAFCVHTGAPSRLVPLLLRAGAVTFGRHVLFRKGRYDPASPRGLALIAHEAGHITQWRDLGVARFLVRYGRGIVAARFAHARHPLERPLNERQRVVRAALNLEDEGRSPLV